MAYRVRITPKADHLLRSIPGGNFFRVVDNQDLDRAFLGVQLESKLFLEGHEDRRRRVGALFGGAFGGPGHFEIEDAIEAGFVDDRAAQPDVRPGEKASQFGHGSLAGGQMTTPAGGVAVAGIGFLSFGPFFAITKE